MAIATNSRIVRLALGCIQPADPGAVSNFLDKAFKYNANLISEESVQEIFDQWSIAGDVVCVHKNLNFIL